MIDLTPKKIVVMDDIENEQDKAVRWALEFSATEISDEDAEKLHWHLYCCQELDSHERIADPRTPEQIDADQDAAEWRATYASLLP